ncbi:MAG: UDP-glucose 4-epimerase GalE [Bacteroidales bacterium]|jgi:UDP-glucose 4-epimerase|nr:UDP-glucose 4-epimerase GalE [Bacteroidales bacterium]
MKKKIIVTGGTGYIGSHTAVELIADGFEVVIIDNLYNSDISVLEGIRAITGVTPKFWQYDLCDIQKLEEVFVAEGRIDAIIHFAAYKAVGESVRKPLEYFRNNLVSLMNLLEMMERHNSPVMVFSSSCTVYGQPDTLPVTEASPVKEAASPYGYTKQAGEIIIRDTMAARPSQKAVSLRYFNPIGAHPTAFLGELPQGVPENLVPFITQTAMGLREELKVFGTDYDTPDGSCIRDYLHVVDLAKAHVTALQRMLEGQNKSNYEVFNLGMGKGVSVLEAIAAFEKATGVKLKYSVTDRRAGDIEKIWADPSLANRELGWKTEISIEEAMETAWRWENRLKNKE